MSLFMGKYKQKNGSVYIDSYSIPKRFAAEFIEAREHCAEQASAVMREFCASVSREWAGSEDGEAVVGCDKNGEIICMIHLDPTGVKRINDALEKNSLKEFLLQHNG